MAVYLPTPSGSSCLPQNGYGDVQLLGGQVEWVDIAQAPVPCDLFSPNMPSVSLLDVEYLVN